LAERADGPAVPPPADAGADELAILAPERRAAIANLVVTMREPTWLESLELEPGLEPIIEELDRELAQASDVAGELIRIVYRITARHRDVMITMMCLCAGVEPAWINALSDRDGRKFFTLFWEVNGHFFGDRVRLARAARAMRAGQTSSRH